MNIKPPPFREAVNRHAGRDFLVCGCGPSLDLYEPADLMAQKWITIGVDYIFQYIIPDYFVSWHWYCDTIHDVRTKQVWATINRAPNGNKTAKDGLVEGSNSTISKCISAAYQMGAGRIFLLGVDASYGPNREKYAKRFPASEISPDDLFERKLINHMPIQIDPLLWCYRNAGVPVYDLCPWGKLSEVERIDKTQLTELLKEV
jgi:hypothetical protein